ncbi:MAG: hypothetical protein HY427_02940 [Candidatus Levybacteria bacterium]|nr:hypothetical protein [Candidatus Levybacteria bacterium]
MEYITIVLYSLFLFFAIFLATYNFLYAQRVGAVSRKLGFGLPRLLKAALKTNTIISIIATVVLTFIFLEALFSLELPTFQ